jgi:hypothetical protein
MIKLTKILQEIKSEGLESRLVHISFEPSKYVPELKKLGRL